jgi:hypothetical protein
MTVFISVLDTEPFVTAAKLAFVPVLQRIPQLRRFSKFIPEIDRSTG